MFWAPTNYLAHHGIKGQKWGVINGPPYPLGSGDHSASEKKAGWRKSLDKKKEKQSKNNADNKKSHGATTNFSNSNKSIQSSKDNFEKELFKKNPNIAMVNPSLKEWAKAHKKEIAIGVGIAAGLAVAGIIIYKRGNINPKKVTSMLETQLGKKSLDLSKISETNIKDLKGFSSNEERFVANWIKADMHRFDPISQSEFDGLSSDDKVFLNAGQKLYRMSKSEHSNLRDGIEYVSFGEDRDRYKGFLPNMWRANGYFGNKFYEMELTSLDNIKAPSKKETIEILETVLRDKVGYKPDVAHKDALKDFYRYSINLIDRSDPISKEILNEVKSRGYNAVVDWNDAGRLADTPLILLNGKGQASVNAVNKLNLRETKEIFKNVNLPSNSMNFSLNDFNSEKLAEMYRPLVKRFAFA